MNPLPSPLAAEKMHTLVLLNISTLGYLELLNIPAPLSLVLLNIHIPVYLELLNIPALNC